MDYQNARKFYEDSKKKYKKIGQHDLFCTKMASTVQKGVKIMKMNFDSKYYIVAKCCEV